MAPERTHNFNAGPSALPLSVLETAREALGDWKGLGMSLLEASHRAPDFGQLLEHAKATLTRLLDIPETHEVLFLQGGASLQFAQVPMNLGTGGAYINTGTWSTKAIKEARAIGPAHEIWSSSEGGFRRVPGASDALEVPGGSSYLHYTSNNTIYGTQWHHTLASTVPLVADMSSDILSRPVDVGQHALIYAGAQKNAGTAGVTIVIADKAVSRGEAHVDGTPIILRYATHAQKASAYNTPPVFAIYLSSLVFDWIEAQGGVTALAELNAKKARRLYDIIDGSDLFRGHADTDSRSLMNVTFTMANPELEQRFLALTAANGCVGLKGHRSVGGLRASIYNAVSWASVDHLAGLMESFDA